MTPEAPLTVEQVPTPEGPLLRIAGDLDYTNAPDLESALAPLALTQDDTLTLDLSEVGFCDSTGLSTLIGVQRKAERAGATIRVSAVDPNLARIMAITGVEHLFGLPTTDLTAGLPGSEAAEA